MARIHAEHGRFRVVENKLTDGSPVYHIETVPDNGGLLVLECIDATRACQIAQSLQLYTNSVYSEAP